MLALAAPTGVALAGTAHADPVPIPVVVDKHSPDGGHGGGHGGPSPGHPTGTPTAVPIDPPASEPASLPPGTSAGQPGTATGPVAGQPGGPAVDAGPASANDTGTTTIGRRLGTGSQLAAADPSGSAAPGHTGARPERANGLGATDSIRLAGTAVPLWLVVGGGALVVLLVAIGLTLTLRDRDKGIEPEDVSTPELPTGVKFG